MITLFRGLQNSQTTIEILIYLFLIILIISLVVGLVLFILSAVALRRMAVREGRQNAWMAFVPFMNLYLFGEIARDDSDKSWIQAIPLTLLLGSIGYLVIHFVPGIGMLYSLCFNGLVLYVSYLVFNKYSHSPVPLLIVSVVTFGMAIPFILFAIRNNDKVDIVLPPNH
ncbi:hypothetical protein MM221_14255 [Salipaludibacillus sp. LMS25]|jgi:hypothetical protein|uniref:hypothetical protein n=1 Tax=Salipaludibacillus sp. LMS25 TaxID=2924031 RepID=UPI0020D0748B|nr:hypothetical protein [Salipaludibacillus sp. LMS25]UTR13768.1 hypothetical protein MM221_14255 [Salipaludibacillus sp. LMS25]